MHLLYLDESGAIADPAQSFFVLAGVAVFERTTHWIEKEMHSIAARFDAANPHSIELHGSPMRSGRGVWRIHPPADRTKAMLDALAIAKARYPRDLRLFGAVVKKSSLPAEDPVEHAFENVSVRFDLFLKRLHLKHSNTQRGIIVFDKCSTEQRIQNLAREFKHVGRQWGKTKNYAEVPVFLDSRASRLIQLADLVSFAMFRHHEHSDSQYYDVIKDCFDNEGGVIHGLYEKLT
jgi:hypothetical protein